MKITIERDRCISCGNCWDTCPLFFEQNSQDTFSQVQKKFQTGDNPAQGVVPVEMVACIIEAADLCPAEIIHTEE